VARALLYLARLYVGQLEKGDPYSKLRRTIGISLTDFVLFPDEPDLHSRYRFHDATHGLELSDILEIHFIELPKFLGDAPKCLGTPFEIWLHVLKYGPFYEDDSVSVPAELQQEEGIEMALDAMRRASASQEVREMIEFRRKAEHDEASRLEHARNEGLEKGREEGLEKGLEKGREEGARRTLIATARRMREDGLDDETIHRVTGLSPDEYG